MESALTLFGGVITTEELEKSVNWYTDPAMVRRERRHRNEPVSGSDEYNRSFGDCNYADGWRRKMESFGWRVRCWRDCRRLNGTSRN